MYVKLTIGERMKDLRVERRLTLEQLAELTQLSKSALGSYEGDDYKDISPFAITTLAQFYGVSTDYLLGVSENKNHPNTALDELHLSDDMVDILKSGKLNHRLLCELVTHKNFERLLVDAEIYVDRIVDMRIADTNAVLDAVRQAVIRQHNPGENDKYLRTLELAQINEGEYFSHVVSEDISRILRDIRNAHRKDSTTADELSSATEIRQHLQAALYFEGSEDERKARDYLAQLGIPYDDLTDDEFVTLIGILKKSKKLKSPYSQRGKQKKKRKK